MFGGFGGGDLVYLVWLCIVRIIIDFDTVVWKWLGVVSLEQSALGASVLLL